ncbi:hypothetical protein CR513_58185, partial [Mucuna pruriens]
MFNYALNLQENNRPFIGVDECLLKTVWRVVVDSHERDGNDQYFHLAVVVVETKTKDSLR